MAPLNTRGGTGAHPVIAMERGGRSNLRITSLLDLITQYEFFDVVLRLLPRNDINLMVSSILWRVRVPILSLRWSEAEEAISEQHHY